MEYVIFLFHIFMLCSTEAQNIWLHFYVRQWFVPEEWSEGERISIRIKLAEEKWELLIFIGCFLFKTFIWHERIKREKNPEVYVVCTYVGINLYNYQYDILVFITIMVLFSFFTNLHHIFDRGKWPEMRSLLKIVYYFVT